MKKITVIAYIELTLIYIALSGRCFMSDRRPDDVCGWETVPPSLQLSEPCPDDVCGGSADTQDGRDESRPYNKNI